MFIHNLEFVPEKSEIYQDNSNNPEKFVPFLSFNLNLSLPRHKHTVMAFYSAGETTWKSTVDSFCQGQYDRILKTWSSKTFPRFVWHRMNLDLSGLRGHKGASSDKLPTQFHLRHFVSSLMSDVELGKDKRRVKTAGRMETS